MKKYLLLFLLPGLLSLSSCSSDDEDKDDNKVDPIVGAWVLVSLEPSGFDFTSCENPSTIQFKENGTATITLYSQDIEGFECVGIPASGGWSAEGVNQYSISGFPIIGDVSGTVEFENEDNFVLTTSEMTMTFEREKVTL